jgi:hypothetical protein
MAALRRALAIAVGADAAAHALQSAGYAAGDAFFRALSRLAGGTGDAESDRAALGALPPPVFWRRLAELFATRGWGHLVQSDMHPGIATLESMDWVESDPNVAAARPSCFFSTGLLANLLGNASGQEVAVLEVECRSRGDRQCRFLFGSPAALDELYKHLAAGVDVQQSLAAVT